MVFVLYTSAICLGLYVVFQWLWKRRDYYLLSWQLPGPCALPIVGNFFDMMNHYGALLIDLFICFMKVLRTISSKIPSLI